MFDMFSGGALEKLTVFALGIMPYISSSIIFQLLTVVVPAIEKLSKEGEAGRKKIIQYTRYGTIVLAVVQALGISIGLESMRGPAGELVVPTPGWGFRIMTVITLTAGTAFIMWLGEQMSEKGIGNGISLIIFAGIVARIPTAIGNSFKLLSAGRALAFCPAFRAAADVCRHCSDRFCRTGAAQGADSLCQKGGRAADVRCADIPSAA